MLLLAVVKTKNGGLRNEWIRKNGDLKLVREAAKALKMAQQGREMIAGDNCTAQEGAQPSAKDSNEVNKITGRDGTEQGTTGPRAAQADQQLSYVTLDVETTPTQREFPVPLGVRTASDAEKAIILLVPVPAENRIVLVGKSEL